MGRLTLKYKSRSGDAWNSFISEQKTLYKSGKSYSVFYHNPEHCVKLFRGDCVKILNAARKESIDMIFADPPYFLSNNGITCKSGKMVSVNKGSWDKSKGIAENYRFVKEWLSLCKRVLKKDGTIWVSGTSHIIHAVGFAMQELDFKILNDIIWYKRNAPPNLSCRYFTHSTETVIWAAKDKNSRHYFDYKLMKSLNGGKQMRNLWEIGAPGSNEKKYGKHPTQKPVALLERIIQSSTQKGDLVLDPFCGSSTTGVAAIRNSRKYIGIDTEEEYLSLSVKRLKDVIAGDAL